MYSNFSSGNNRRPSSYKYNPSSYNRNRRPNRNRRRTRNRIIIVLTGLVALVLVVSIISSFFNCLCSGCSNNKESTLDTSTVNTKTTKATEKLPDALTLNFKEPDIEDDGSDGEMSNNLYLWNKTAFELFYGSDDSAKAYAKTINQLKKKLGKDISVFDMVVPNHTEMGLPARLKNVEGGATTGSQADYIKTLYKSLDKSVIPVSCYNALSKHCNEYIYFNTDHHWTGLGAYYAYTAFAEATKQKALPLSKCEKRTIEGFTGSFVTMLGSDSGLKTDTVNYWTFPYSVPTTITNANGSTNDFLSCYYPGAGAGSNTYGVFLWGDNPVEVIKSECSKAKDKILIVHESYGNAIVPYFTYNYKEIHSIDFRSWNGDLYKYCKENEIKNVLFVNGVMSSATAFQVQSMAELIP